MSRHPPPSRYDAHYTADAAACGAPFPRFAAVAAQLPPGRVLDLGCGQGRDALVFARAGHAVVGIDTSAVGIAQLQAVAAREGLPIEARMGDLRSFESAGDFDAVILDRVLHMLSADERPAALSRAMAAVRPGGHLLIAEGPKGLAPLRAALHAAGWTATLSTRNRLFARRPMVPGTAVVS